MLYGSRRADQKKSIDELYAIITIAGVIVTVLLLAAIVMLPVLANNFSVASGPLIFSFGFFVPAFLLGIVSQYIIKLQSLNTPSEQTTRLPDTSEVSVADMELDLSKYNLRKEILLTDDRALVERLLSKQH